MDENLAERTSRGHAAFHELTGDCRTRAASRNRAESELLGGRFTTRTTWPRCVGSTTRSSKRRKRSGWIPCRRCALESGVHHWFSGRYERSTRQRSRPQLNPGYTRIHEDLGRCYEQIGALDRAIEEFGKAESPATLSPRVCAGRKRSEATKFCGGWSGQRKQNRLRLHFALIFIGLERRTRRSSGSTRRATSDRVRCRS